MKVTIWYMKDDFFRLGAGLGSKYLAEKNALPDKNDLSKTHVELLTLNDRDPEQVFHDMQGEIWSPNGEQLAFIRSKKISHTSMSVGDVLVYEDGRVLMVDFMGFYKL